MKQLRNTGILIIILLISLILSGYSNPSGDLVLIQPDHNSNEAVIGTPENLLLAFLLPENETNQFHSIKKPVTENRLIRPAFSSFSKETHGRLHSAVEYFDICDQILLRLTISAIIFPFNYHW